MKLEVYFDGHFSTEEHIELGKISNEISVDWTMSFLPLKDDYICIEKFIGKLPVFVKEGLWRVIDREFLDNETILLGLMLI